MRHPVLLAAQPHPVFVGTGCVTTPGVSRHPAVERTRCAEAARDPVRAMMSEREFITMTRRCLFFPYRRGTRLYSEPDTKLRTMFNDDSAQPESKTVVQVCSLSWYDKWKWFSDSLP